MPLGRRVLVTGAGGFIGHHLVSYLKKRGYWVRGVDIKSPEFEPTVRDHIPLNVPANDHFLLDFGSVSDGR